jgi:eukaryotic-like serine/threonine-protein kinase
MGLTQKILLFTSLLVVALVGVSLAFTTFQADRLAHENITRGLADTRQVWEAFQADRYNKLKLGVRTLGNDPTFKAGVSTDPDTVYDMLKERGKDIGADFFIATDADGTVISRSDRPTAQGEDMSAAPLVKSSLEGQESATIWRQGDKLFHAVSVPMQFGQDIVGVLIAGFGMGEHLASDIRKLTRSEVAFLTHAGVPPKLSVSSLGPKEADLKTALVRPELASGGTGNMEPFELDLSGERHVGVQVPLKTANGETVGSMLALRSLAEEMGAFRRFRNSLVVVSLAVMVLGMGIAFLVARNITGPVRTLVGLVDRARSGSYTGKVEVDSRDEIGTLARAFNRLLTELREKEQMIGFLREGMTVMKKRGPLPDPEPAAATGVQETANLSAVTIPGVNVHNGDLFASRYQVLSTVGKGGMGVVYRAHDRTLDEEVALKVLRPDVMKQDATLLERFKQEIKLARKISHRNVLRTHDFGESDGIPYISMEYLEGVTLKDLLTSKGALPLGVGLRIAKQMCQGLEAAHHQGVVHRDIKPQNMLILPESGDLKIMDFGIARVSEVKDAPQPRADSGLTTAGTVMGTPDYMSPEQAQGSPADFRSDIYSLGVVLYEVFTGRLPFTGENVMQVVLAHIQQQAARPRSLNPKVPPSLERIIVRCMEKVPGRRYEKLGDMLNDLTEVSSEAEAPAPRPGPVGPGRPDSTIQLRLASVQEAIKAFESGSVDRMVADDRMWERSDLEKLRALQRHLATQARSSA